jgi:hypothetical protein
LQDKGSGDLLQEWRGILQLGGAGCSWPLFLFSQFFTSLSKLIKKDTLSRITARKLVSCPGLFPASAGFLQEYYSTFLHENLAFAKQFSPFFESGRGMP